MSAPEQVALDDIVRILLDQYGPIEKIILFGSYARGETDEYSDLDLILIKKTTKRFIERLGEVPLLPVHADVFVYTPEEFERMRENENPFILSALESAKIIYGDGPAEWKPSFTGGHSRQNALRSLGDAENTLRSAEKIYRQEESYNYACFFAEQSALKALKSVRYLDGAPFITIHSVSELIREVAQKRPEFLPLREEAGVLDQYYLTTRYPDAVAEPAIPSEIFTKKQAEEALRIARSIFEMSRSLIR